MGSIYDGKIKVSIFGQSHSQSIGVLIDGLPAGYKIDTEELNKFMQRRAPGKNKMSTARKEGDRPIFLSGLNDSGITCGAPLCAIINNNDTRSGDYSELADKPRPGHADYTAHVKYGGNQDVRGGGHFSGRLTAPLCIAGGIFLQILKAEGITIGAHVKSIKDVSDVSFDTVNIDPVMLETIGDKEVPVIDETAEVKIREVIENARMALDSVGGVIECAAVGLPVGLGDPMFDGMENRVARLVFGIPAIKGIEFGAGFEVSKMFGSENNDTYYYDTDGKVKTRTNNHGGILGGITSGMPMIFRCAVKPTSSIMIEQDTISIGAKENAKLAVRGRHDPCITIRAVPCVVAATAIAVYDALLEQKMSK